MVTRVSTYLATNSLPVVVLPLGRYLLPLTVHDKHQPEIVMEFSFSGVRTYSNIAIARYRMSLVNTLLFNFVSIH